MTDTQRCMHDMLPGQCAPCRGITDGETLSALLFKHALTAQYDGRCYLNKSHGIAQGDAIWRLVDADDGETVGYACQACADAANDAPIQFDAS